MVGQDYGERGEGGRNGGAAAAASGHVLRYFERAIVATGLLLKLVGLP